MVWECVKIILNYLFYFNSDMQFVKERFEIFFSEKPRINVVVLIKNKSWGKKALKLYFP